VPHDQPSETRLFFDRLMPESLEAVLARALGTTIPRMGEDGRYRISSSGRFSGRIAADLLAFVRNQKHDGAFVLFQDDVVRLLYTQRGVITGADSNVLFERLGRVLHRAGTLDRDSSRHVVTCEEQRGLGQAIKLLPADAVQWGLEKRTWEIGTALFFMAGAHFVIVDGPPALGDVPALAVAPMELAIEGVRRYDEWRNKSAVRPPEALATASVSVSGSVSTTVDRGVPRDVPEESEEDLAATPRSTARRISKDAEPLDVDEIMRILTQ
jgi:hypothetical protein